jgi:hypothetical protein
MPLTIGQLFSPRLSGWSRTVYFAAALQTFHLVVIYGATAFWPLWLLPSLVAAALMMTGWAAAEAVKGPAIEAMRVAARNRG